MSEAWWQLPGPAAFVDDLVADLREGRSLVITEPLHTPPGLRPALRRRLEAEDVWGFAAHDLAEGDGLALPDQVLRKHVRGLAQSEGFACLLAGAASARHLVLWVEGLKPEALGAWRGFLEDFDHAARQEDDTHPRLCLCLTGYHEPPEGLMKGLAVTRHRGCAEIADRFDMGLFNWQRWRRKGGHRLLRMIGSAMCTELAGTDPELAARLGVLSLAELEHPIATLRSVGEAAGWCDGTQGPPSVADGRVEIWEGQPRGRSSWVACTGDAAEINRRIWRAQVAVLFPFIEEQRAAMLRDLSRYWKLPLQTRFGPVTDVNDLELSHMARLASEQRAPRSKIALLETMTEIRHRLAHVNPVPAKDIELLASVL